MRAAASSQGLTGERGLLSGRSGKEQLDSNASMGVAELRRDGFTSVSAAGSSAVLTSRPVRVAADRTMMFVNVQGEAAALKVRGDEGISEALQTYRFLARRT